VTRIKITHVVHSLEVGGLENGLVNVINHLAPSVFSHSIICLIRSGELAKRIIHEDVSIRELGLNPNRFKFPVMRLAKMFRELRPDIVHTRAWGTIDGVMAARVAGVRRVIHGEHGRHAADPEGRNRKRILLRKCLSPMIDRFTTVSDDLKRWLTETVGIAPQKIVRIHNGVDTERFSLSGRDVARHELGLDASVIAIGTVARLDPVKDHGSLLRAFASIRQSGAPVCLVIVGDGSMRHHIESQIRDLRIGDRVRLLGERQDVAKLLTAFDVFSLTSIAEGMSNTILEAMACGLPVVATRVGGNPELVEHHVNGQLVKVGDVRDIASAFQSYVDNANLRRDHARNARRIAEQKFGLERMAAQYAQLYQALGRTREDQAA